MKFNWGTGIVVAFVGFISFILYFVITMSTNKKYEHDLVIENYYGQELEFQNAINKEVHSQTLKQDIIWKRTSEGLLIEFPENFKPEDISGTIALYRPSNKLFDFEIVIALSNHTILITDKRLLNGRWNLKVDWKVHGEAYLYKKEIIY
ncbi:FixH family protein [Mariniflexile sp. AS56]|uniref:FixH family protein n=1 Tax=Mariniflexile sp. AS56 TaxID=3063957 RepID=UPI0026EA2974|nr:FixH family protein [Mariniflexile sp. AS56]MDO7171104.1 FixH family protein [Mariniflexile sp. AS56]